MVDKMKKIDLHIHTIATDSDANFEFDINKLNEYITTMELDAIAITNHNIFDKTQFNQISNTLKSTVLPGIEINIGNGPGHIILIADIVELDDFTIRCSKVSEIIKTAKDTIHFDKLKEIFVDLSKYLIIPHYNKSPNVDLETLKCLGNNFIAGEVTSFKKFIYALKDDTQKTPVLFSDSRAKSDWVFKTRQTYIDTSSIDIRSIKLCLSNKNSVALSTQEGNELIQVTPNGIKISDGLTVILGGRSSGKSRTLDQIKQYTDNAKYIKQFQLIEMDPENEAKKFNERVGRRQTEYGDNYLNKFRDVISDIKNIDLKNDDKDIDTYVTSLLKYANDQERHDVYSNTSLFSETEFIINNSEKLLSIIEATKILLSPGKYQKIIRDAISHDNLMFLFNKLIEEYRKEEFIRKKLIITNDLVRSIKRSLGSVSAISPIKDIDLFEIAHNRAKVTKFIDITKELQKPRTITRNLVGKFAIEERSVPVKGPQDLKDICGKVIGFSSIFPYYSRPYDFLSGLKSIDGVDPATYYKYFTKIEYRILNQYNTSVSGGERAEFRLINEISDAANYDLLLIDEPESSFDNMFLSEDVNRIIKTIAKNTPVVIVTHNNTIGASIRPDYIIHTERKIIGNKPEYKIFMGRATDKELVAIDGEKINNSELTMKYLEAGRDLYQERNKIYEMLEN